MRPSTGHIPEQPVIRPPSEWRSTLIRVTRGCNWNRCRFCGIYPHLGEPDYSERSIEEISKDIKALHLRRPQAREFFLGDADPLNSGVETISQVISLLKQTFDVGRITAYARFSTLKKLGPEVLKQLAVEGLSRIHLGLESGDREILRFQRKGQSPEMVITVSDWLKEAGIEQSFYVLLGLGGRERWQEHMLETARVINRTKPDFVRIRRIWLFQDSPLADRPGCPLQKQIDQGNFSPQSPDGTVHELALLLQNLLPSPTFLTCDHANNFIQVHGQLDQDLEDMRREVNAFLSLSERERQTYYEAHGNNI